jgi:hypothetical protein
VTGPVEVGAAVAYAAPVGSAEAGSRIRDTAFGVGAIDGDVSYRFTRTLGAVVWGRYGGAIPTLCATASDCVASLGRDIELAARARVYLPTLLRFEPHADAGVGFEWFMTKLSDVGATSRRSFAGPIGLSLQVAMPWRISERWSIGPVADGSFGVFTTSSLDTPSFTRDRGTDGRAVHGWLSIAVRTAVRF